IHHCVLQHTSSQRYLSQRDLLSFPTLRSSDLVLFDIVGFGLLHPFEQMAQLNSLSYSLNSAQSKLLDRKIGVDFARTTTGDGFYVWNRDLDIGASINLYHLMYLVLADNAIARQKAKGN